MARSSKLLPIRPEAALELSLDLYDDTSPASVERVARPRCTG
jgi:hypothetical protein